MPPLYFAPKTLNLSYNDDEGTPVTSVVLMPTVAPGRASALTEGQKELYDRVVALGARATKEKIIDGLGRKPDLRKRLENLEGSIFTVSADGVYSLRKGVTQTEEDF